MTDTRELKACPHCAHDRTYFDKDWPSDHVGYYLSLRCSKCKACTRSIHCYEDDPMVYQELKELWNTRAQDSRCGELVEAAKEAQDALAATKHLLFKYAEDHDWLPNIKKAIDRQAKAIAAFESSHEK